MKGHIISKNYGLMTVEVYYESEQEPLYFVGYYLRNMLKCKFYPDFICSLTKSPYLCAEIKKAIGSLC